MESNGYEHKLFEAVKQLSTIARAAYWEGWNHCEGDTSPDCIDCRHHTVCQAMDKLDDAMLVLVGWNC